MSPKTIKTTGRILRAVLIGDAGGKLVLHFILTGPLLVGLVCKLMGVE